MTDPRNTQAKGSAILQEMDRQAQPAPGVEHRQNQRYHYRLSSGLMVLLHHPGGTASTCIVIPRNLSEGGLSFLHSSYVHPETRCIMKLPTLDGEPALVPGRVVRCSHISARAHEVGVEFDRMIDVGNHVAEARSEAVGDGEPVAGPPRFSGKVLYADDSVDSRELVCFLLRRLGVDLHVCPDGESALDRAKKSPFDLVLLSVHLRDIRAPEMAEALRANGYEGPIVICTRDEKPQPGDEALARRFGAALIKTFDSEGLTRMLGEHLPLDNSPTSEIQPLFSSKWSDVAMQPVILAFLDRLEDKVRWIEHLLAVEDTQTVQDLCRELKASATGYGYKQISAAAREMETIAAESVSREGLETKFNELADLCTAACQVRNEASAH